MRLNKMVLVAALLVSGCAFTNNTYDDKGNPATEIRCSWAFPDACFREADKICPNGYRTISKDMEFNMFKHQHVLNIACKK